MELFEKSGTGTFPDGFTCDMVRVGLPLLLRKGQYMSYVLLSYCLNIFIWGIYRNMNFNLSHNTLDGRATDIFRDCLESIEGVEDCVTASRYIDEVIRPDFPNIRDFVSGEDGVACYCVEDLCNSELGEPDVPGKTGSLLIEKNTNMLLNL